MTPVGEPFPGVWDGIEDREHWRRIAAEGIFTVPQEAVPSVPITPIETVAPTEPVPSTEEATVTLGELYLKQGHLPEAASTFREVLEREPENLGARERLQEIEAQEAPPGAEIESKERKARALKNYLRRLRTGADEQDH